MAGFRTKCWRTSQSQPHGCLCTTRSCVANPRPKEDPRPAVVDASAGIDVTFTEIGPVELKGISGVRPHAAHRGNVADLLAAYHHWHPQVRAILQTFEVTFRWAIFERSPMPRWSSGRVTLLGDACHAMLPFLAQGAAQAMEDGVTLATLLSNLDSRAAVPDALRVYESVRRPRVTRVQHMASDNKTRLNMPDGPGQRARDAELAKGTTDIFFSAWEWLYQYNPEAALRSTHRTDLHRNRNRDPA